MPGERSVGLFKLDLWYADVNQGTIPFLSVALLQQISDALQQQYSKKNPAIYKEDRATSIRIHDEEDDIMVRHEPADDIESLFYVLVWNMILYDGPLGRERKDFNFKSSILGRWSERAIRNLENARSSKAAFILDPELDVLSAHVSPYFSDLVPLAEQWRGIFREKLNAHQKVDFDPLLHVTNKWLETTSPEDPPEITNQRLTMQAEKDFLRQPLVADCTQLKSGQKRNVRSMGDLPFSHLHKRPRGE